MDARPPLRQQLRWNWLGQASTRVAVSVLVAGEGSRWTWGLDLFLVVQRGRLKEPRKITQLYWGPFGVAAHLGFMGAGWFGG